MRFWPGFLALALVVSGTSPAWALMCTDSPAPSTLRFGFHIGEPYSERERNEVDLMRLRREGVDATAVERWSGCIRAYVRLPGGGQEMQFFEPHSLRRVQ